jgi:hypothetical protein
MKKNAMGGTCSTYEGEDRCIQGFGEEIGSLVRPRHRWENVTKMYL